MVNYISMETICYTPQLFSQKASEVKRGGGRTTSDCLPLETKVTNAGIKAIHPRIIKQENQHHHAVVKYVRL